MLKLNPTDKLPRAPSAAAWAAMSPEAQARVIEALPCYMTDAELQPPEGDRHRIPISDSKDALEGWFKGQNRGVYVGLDLMVYYPDETRFAPDVFVALDVDPRLRDKWVVSAEGRGLDWVLEVLYSGDRHKDLVHNVERYARLGVPEYFVFDPKHHRLHGWRLPHPGARVYEPIIPQLGRYAANVLGLQIAIEGHTLRYYAGNAMVLQSQEVLSRLSETTEWLQRQYDASEKARLAELSAKEDALSAQADAQRALAASEQRIAALMAQLARHNDPERH